MPESPPPLSGEQEEAKRIASNIIDGLDEGREAEELLAREYKRLLAAYEDRSKAFERAAADCERLEGEANRYRIEADCAMRDYDGLEVDAGIMLDALTTIERGRRNELFDPWAQSEARMALEALSERVRALRCPPSDSDSGDDQDPHAHLREAREVEQHQEEKHGE